MKKFLLPACMIWIVAIQSFAQSSHLKFDHFTVKEGLPSRNISFIQQDAQGYMWVGTENGLMRYDGYTPKVYRFGGGKDAIVDLTSPINMVTDANKTIWVSTYGNGLFRFDRQTDHFIQYPYPQKAHKKEAFAEIVQQVDKNNNLWSLNAAFNGNHLDIIKFNQHDSSFEEFGNKQYGPHRLDITNAYGIYKTADGVIWITTDNGLYRYQTTKNTFDPFLAVKDTNRRISIFDAYEAPSEPGILWLAIINHAKEKSIIRFDIKHNSTHYYNHDTNPDLKDGAFDIRDIHEDKNGHLWFATHMGVLLFDRHTSKFHNYSPVDAEKDSTKNDIYAITEGPEGHLWLSSGGGLLNFSPRDSIFQTYKPNPDDPGSISSEGVQNIIFDRSGVMWLQAGLFGLNKVNKYTSAFVTETFQGNNPKGYPGGTPGQIKVGPGGYIWFTNKFGIYKWKPGSENFEQIYKPIKSDGVLLALALSKDAQTVYFSGTDNGLHIYHVATHKMETYVTSADTSSISGNSIWVMACDHTGLLWIATSGKGICSFNPVTQQFKRYPYIKNDGHMASHGKLDDWGVLKIYEDKEGTLWFGTNGGGLNRFDRKTGKFISYLNDSNYHAQCVQDLLEDSKGRLWVGTFEDGAFEFDIKNGKFLRHIYEDNGLIFNTICGITEDNDGFIFINTSRGVSRLNPKNMSLTNFALNTVLPGKEYNARIVNDNNVMVFGLLNGITAFNPEDLKSNPIPPEVHIERVGYSDPAAITDTSTIVQTYGRNSIELPHNQDRITFNYVALHFVNPAQNKYAYLLKGFDKHWVQAGTQRSVTYTNIPPGTYTFMVKACNSDGVWNNTPDRFIVIIDSPWWTKWWAWLFYMILFAGAIYTFVAYRSRRLTRQNKLLEHKVRLRTNEVLQQKEEIETQRDNLGQALEELKTTQGQLVQREKMASLGELTAGIAHEIQNPLNFVNNFSEVNLEMLEELKAESVKPKAERDDQQEIELINDLINNEQKINHHGKRADSIVKGMLEHSRASTGQKEPTDINKLADEYLRLSYHGLRAKDKSFNADLITHFDEHLPLVSVIPQDIGRVMLNLFNNAFYAVHQRKKFEGDAYKPEVNVTTAVKGGFIEITVSDNGTGIPEAIKDKIMQPFFTTKPTGEGTGLGLSLSYDIVVKGHDGKIQINSVEGEGSEFIMLIPIA